MLVVNILQQLEDTSSRLEKEAILNKYKENVLLQDIFRAAQNPYVNYFIIKISAPIPETTNGLSSDETIRNFIDDILVSLANKDVTGKAAREYVRETLLEMGELEQKWCMRILLKNLRCGVSTALVEKVWPGLVPKFSVQLAETLNVSFSKTEGIQINEPLTYPVWVEPKLDGLRCVAIKNNGVVTLHTRTGSEINTLPAIKKSLENSNWDNFVVDGELMGDNWNESISIIMSGKNLKDDSKVVFHLFDIMPLEQWINHKCESVLKDRRIELIKFIQTTPYKHESPFRNIAPVHCELVYSLENLLDTYKLFLENGFEGAMIKDANSQYCFKRTKAMLKMKPLTTFEGIITATYEGNPGTRREHEFAGFVVLLPNGVTTNVGGGFTDALRAKVNDKPKEYIGKIVEIEGQPDPATKDGLTKDGKIRFPVFTRFRDVNDVDQAVIETLKNVLEAQTNEFH
jgi:hypothetical protein